MEIDRNELSEAVRLMQTASSLAGSWRREVERKSADTFWRSVGFEGSASARGTVDARRLATPEGDGLVLRRANF